MSVYLLNKKFIYCTPRDSGQRKRGRESTFAFESQCMRLWTWTGLGRMGRVGRVDNVVDRTLKDLCRHRAVSFIVWLILSSASGLPRLERNHEARISALRNLNQQHYQRSDGKSTHGFRSWELSDWFCSGEYLIFLGWLFLVPNNQIASRPWFQIALQHRHINSM